jgi:hypothetical protein
MRTLSRWGVVALASSFAAAPLVGSLQSLAQSGPPAKPSVFDISDFAGAGLDADARFAKALAAISRAAAEMNKAGKRASFKFSRR